MSLDAPPELARPITERPLPHVQLLASRLHQAVCRLSGLNYTQPCLTTREIAQLLGVSERTVSFHITNIMRKLGVVNRH